MHPSFGVPWPRLQRAAERLEKLHPAAARSRVHALLFLCGLNYLLTYREANAGRRLSHYLDDGLREAVDGTLPVLMRRCSAVKQRQRGRRVVASDPQRAWTELVTAVGDLHRRLPVAAARWAGGTDANLVRLSFGMGAVARFSPEAYDFVRRLLSGPLDFPPAIVDVIDSFEWHPDWSVALTH